MSSPSEPPLNHIFSFKKPLIRKPELENRSWKRILKMGTALTTDCIRLDRCLTIFLQLAANFYRQCDVSTPTEQNYPYCFLILLSKSHFVTGIILNVYFRCAKILCSLWSWKRLYIWFMECLWIESIWLNSTLRKTQKVLSQLGCKIAAYSITMVFRISHWSLCRHFGCSNQNCKSFLLLGFRRSPPPPRGFSNLGIYGDQSHLTTICQF